MNKLQVLRDIVATLKKFIDVRLKYVNAPWPTNLEIWRSKIGGLPYLPKNIEYPRNKTDNPLNLLAQINFIDMPLLPLFPRDGLLQIYINNDVSYGKRNDNEEDIFKIIYVPNDGTYPDCQDLSFLKPPLAFDYFPAEGVHQLDFLESRQSLSIYHPNFYHTFKKYFKNETTKENFYDEEFTQLYKQLIFLPTCQIGGYSSLGLPEEFEEPVLHKYYRDTLQVLFMLQDKGDDRTLCIGDCNMLAFLITEKDLQALNFSNVLYYSSIGST